MVASTLSSSSPVPVSKLKKSIDRDPQIVFGRDLDPPKYSLPSWKVADRGHPRVLLQTSHNQIHLPSYQL